MSDIDMMLPLLFVYQGDKRFDVQIHTEPGGGYHWVCVPA